MGEKAVEFTRAPGSSKTKTGALSVEKSRCYDALGRVVDSPAVTLDR